MILSLALYCPFLIAYEAYQDWESLDSLGVGGASTTTISSENSIFINPAGLSRGHNPRDRSRFSKVNPINLMLGGSRDAIPIVSHNIGNIQPKLFSAAQQNINTQYSVEAQSFPVVIISGKEKPSFLIGFPMRYIEKVSFQDSTNTNVANVKAIATAGAALGFAYSFKGSAFSFGFSVRPNYRIDYENSSYNTQVTSVASFYTTAYNQGISSSALPMDAGIILTAPDLWFPSFALSIRNIPTGCLGSYTNPLDNSVIKMCGTMRSGGKTSSPMTSQIDPTEVRAGMSIVVRERIGLPKVNLRLSGDVYPIPIRIAERYYGIPYPNYEQLFHGGLEFFTGTPLEEKRFSLRMGYQNSAVTFGATLSIASLQLQYASYIAVDSLNDTDTAAGKTFSERRHLLSVAMNW